MKRPTRLLLSLACALLLSACGGDSPKLSADAVRELGELQSDSTPGEDEMVQEYLELFARVQAAGDVKQASTPHRITLLHLAALFKKPQLVADLLKAGADPNARTLVPAPEGQGSGLRPGDPVLAWALSSPVPEGVPASEILPIVDALLAAGADVRAQDEQGMPLLATCCNFNIHPTAEDVFLHLLARGAATECKPAQADAETFPLGYWVAGRCWPRAIASLLDKGYAPTGMLPELARNADVPGALDCARLLLERGVSPDECHRDGTPALCMAATTLQQCLDDGDISKAEREQARAMVLLLLQAGASATQPCGEESDTPGLCAADLLRGDEELPASLAAAGLPPLPPPALDFSGEGEALRLAQVCRAGRLAHKFSNQDIAPHADRLAALLTTPTEAEQASVLFPQASGEALSLLARVDAARAARLMATHPCWKDEDWDEEDSVNGVMLAVAENEHALVLPATFLQQQAVAREAAGQPDLAATFIELLARDPKAAATIERLCTDERLGLRVGALTARLRQAGLPQPRDGAVADWARVRGLAFESLPPVLQTAWLATSLGDIWFDEVDEAKRASIIEALRRIGADKAAAFYEKPAGEADPDMALELEELTAKYFWEHRADFERFPRPQH